MQCPALGKVPGGFHELTIKATATGITFLHDRKFKSRYNGSKTCAIGINGEIWPRRADYLKMQALKIPSRLIENKIDGLYYLDKERYRKETTPKRKKKAGTPPSLILSDLDDRQPVPGINHLPAISGENSITENNSQEIIVNSEKKQRKKEYSINKREVRQRILTYINTMKGKKELYFFTVSFPEGSPDDACYKAFNTWLTTLRRSMKGKDGRIIRPMLREYLWVAERQLGEKAAPGKKPTLTIHFHIAIPHYMDVTKANAAMKTILRNMAKNGEIPGAVCSAKTGESYYKPSISRYNGVDICKHRKTRRVINFAVKKGSAALAHYLTKYVTKNAAGEKDENGDIPIPAFTRLAWHNSRGFSKLFTGVAFTVAEFTKFGFRPFLNRVRIFRMEHATFIPWLFGPPPLLIDHLYEVNSYIQFLTDGTN